MPCLEERAHELQPQGQVGLLQGSMSLRTEILSLVRAGRLWELPGLPGNHVCLFSESGCGEQQCLRDLASTVKPAEVLRARWTSLDVSEAVAGPLPHRNGLTPSGLRYGMTQWRNASTWKSGAACRHCCEPF